MKRMLIENTQLRIHFKVKDKVLDKAINLVKEFNAGNVRARKLGCGHFSVLDVTRNERIVIKDDILNLMSHEQYNKYVERR